MPTVLDEGVTIDRGLPPIEILTRTHELAAAKTEETGSASVLQILQLIERGDLPPNVESALLLAESALQAIADGSISTAKLASNSLSADATGRGKMADKFVTNAKLADMAQATVKGRASGAGTGDPTDLAASDLFTILNGVFPARPITSAAAGQFVLIDTSASVGNGYSLPLGGTWAYFAFRVSNSGTVPGANAVGSVAAGGTTILAGLANHFIFGFAWRIA